MRLRNRLNDCLPNKKQGIKSRIRVLNESRRNYDLACVAAVPSSSISPSSGGFASTSQTAFSSMSPLNSSSGDSSGGFSSSSHNGASSASFSSNGGGSSASNVCNENGTCDAGEDPGNCAADCGCNYDNLCQSERGESAANCLPDCYSSDLDDDGLPDGWEYENFGNLDQGPRDDPDGDWVDNLEEFQSGTSPTELNNLVPNAGFELGADGNGVPLNWRIYSTGGLAELDSDDPHSGSYSWKITRVPDGQGQHGYLIGTTDLIAVDSSKTYLLSANLRSQSGEEAVTLGWEEYDENLQNINVSFFVLSPYDYPIHLPTHWTKFTGYPKQPMAQTKWVRIRIGNEYPDRRWSIWLDDVQLIAMGGASLRAFGCENTATARCLKFGSNQAPDINYSANAMGPVQSDQGLEFRELLGASTVEISFPAFSIDANGLPLTPILLEIRYKDTIDASQGAEGSNWTYHRAFVSARQDYLNLDPEYGLPSSEKWAGVVYLGDANDGVWKYTQYSFQNSPYQMIRAKDGRYIVKIEMPNLLVGDPSLRLPIDYVSLRVITPVDDKALRDRRRSFLGIAQAQTPFDEPDPPVNYPNPDLVVFQRDLMQPIYYRTKPALSELTSALESTATQDELAALSLGMYSQPGLTGLSFQASDLVNASSGERIAAADIQFLRIVQRETRTPTLFGEHWMLQPDYLTEVSSLDIAPHSSERLWIRVKAPADGQGVYQGTLTISQGRTALRQVQINLDILPLTLERSEHSNLIWWDPWHGNGGSIRYQSLADVFKVYRQTGFEPILIGDLSPQSDGHGGVILDSTKFAQKLDRLRNEGLLTDRMTIFDSGMPSYFLRSLNGQWPNWSDPDIYDRLSQPDFVNAITSGIQRYLSVTAARGINPWFFIWDEPMTYPIKRIVSDRMYSIIKAAHGETTVTYNVGADTPLAIDPNEYHLPQELGQTLPPLTSLIDHKIWTPGDVDEGYKRTSEGHGPGEGQTYYPDFGYYTTSMSYYRNPIYNRYWHGLFAFATNAKSVHAYAFMDNYVDPWDDFDPPITARGTWTYPDFLLAYPTSDGHIFETMGLEGLRLGILDARYIATLKKLIQQHTGDPNYSAICQQAGDYLNNLKGSLSPNLMADYLNAQPTYEDGYYEHVLKQVSRNGNPYDFQAFSTVRQGVVDYIKLLIQ